MLTVYPTVRPKRWAWIREAVKKMRRVSRGGLEAIAASGKERNQLLRVGFPPVVLSALDINCVILMSHSGHISWHSITSCFLTAPVGDLMSVKRWRSLSNGCALLLSVCHWFLMPRGHKGIISYFRDQRSILMIRNGCSPGVEADWETCMLSSQKICLFMGGMFNPADNSVWSALFIICLVPKMQVAYVRT